MELEVQDFHREDFYLAQIAAEVRRSVSSQPSQVKVEDFILKFKEASDTPLPRLTLAQSKAFWLGSLGLKEKKEDET